MISGSINAQRKGVIRLSVSGSTGRSEAIEAVVDTGFTGFLVLPSEVIARLGLVYVGEAMGRVATGGHAPMDVYHGAVDCDGDTLSVYVLASSGPCLVGVSLMYGFVLTFEAVDGGRVILARLGEARP